MTSRTMTSRFARWRPLGAVSAAGALALSAVTALAAPRCQIDTPPPKSAEQQAQDVAKWGHWTPFEERMVKVNWDLSPLPTYHLLMKRPGNQAHLDKPLVIFLHGFPEFAYSWENWLNVIGAQHDAIAIDLKGFGDSSKPTELSAYNFYRITFEIESIASCLGYKQVIPVGHDWGGTFAWMYSMLFPAQTKAVVILSTPHPYTFFRELAKPDSEQSKRSQYINFVRENTPEGTAAFRRIVDPMMSELLNPFYDGARAQRLLDTNMASDWDWDRMFSYYRAMDLPASPSFYKDKPGWLPLTIMKVRAPTLAFYGADDPVFDISSWRGAEQFVPQLDLRILPGQGHFINHSAPELPGEVLDFINDQTTP